MLIYNVLSWLNYILQSQMKFLTIQVVLTMKDYTNQIGTYVNMETLKCILLLFVFILIETNTALHAEWEGQNATQNCSIGLSIL